MQASTYMMVCNLAVLVTWLLRALGRTGAGSEPPSARMPCGSGGRGGSGSTSAKDLTTLRIHHTGPIVLRTLDDGGRETFADGDVEHDKSGVSAEKPDALSAHEHVHKKAAPSSVPLSMSLSVQVDREREGKAMGLAVWAPPPPPLDVRPTHPRAWRDVRRRQLMYTIIRPLIYFVHYYDYRVSYRAMAHYRNSPRVIIVL